MACRIFGAERLSELIMVYFQLGLKKHISVVNQKLQIFIQENAF